MVRHRFLCAHDRRCSCQYAANQLSKGQNPRTYPNRSSCVEKLGLTECKGVCDRDGGKIFSKWEAASHVRGTQKFRFGFEKKGSRLGQFNSSGCQSAISYAIPCSYVQPLHSSANWTVSVTMTDDIEPNDTNTWHGMKHVCYGTIM